MLPASPGSAAGVPFRVNFQGKLLNTSNVPRSGAISMEFAIYDAPSGGNVLWGPETQVPTVTNGVFSVQLGAVLALTPEVFTGAATYLGVNVEADGEMTPRQRLVAGPYAVTAAQLAQASDIRINAGVAYATFTSAGNLLLPYGIVATSASFSGSLTASSGTFKATGNTQYSLETSSGINILAGTLNVAEAVSAASFVGDGSALSNVSVPADSIDSTKLQASSVTGPKIAALAVDSAKIAALTIDSTKLARSSVDSEKLAKNSVDSEKIVALSIDSKKLRAGSVDSEKLAANSVWAANIMALNVDSTKLAKGSVDSEKLAKNSVDSEKLAMNSVDSEKIVSLSIDSTKLAKNSVDSEKIVALSIDSTKLRGDSVDSEKLAANSVWAANIMALNIDSTKLAVASVDSEKLAKNSVNSEKIAAYAVGSGKYLLNVVQGYTTQTGAATALAGAATVLQTFTINLATLSNRVLLNATAQHRHATAAAYTTTYSIHRAATCVPPIIAVYYMGSTIVDTRTISISIVDTAAPGGSVVYAFCAALNAGTVVKVYGRNLIATELGD